MKIHRPNELIVNLDKASCVDLGIKNVFKINE